MRARVRTFVCVHAHACVWVGVWVPIDVVMGARDTRGQSRCFSFTHAYLPPFQFTFIFFFNFGSVWACRYSLVLGSTPPCCPVPRTPPWLYPQIQLNPTSPPPTLLFISSAHSSFSLPRFVHMHAITHNHSLIYLFLSPSSLFHLFLRHTTRRTTNIS